MTDTLLFTGISELVQPHLREGNDREPIDVTRDAALLVVDGRIAAAGPAAVIRAHPEAVDASRVALDGRAVLPGLVDSHTHVVFAGSRVDEMARRARGETYEQIAKAGGGIARSAALLAQTTAGDLAAASLPRVAAMLRKGTTTCEIKTGYGLLPEHENKHLDAIGAVARATRLSVVATVLAHSVPPAYRERRAEYVRRFCDEVLRPAAARGLARYCDVFVEQNVFSADEARLIASVGKEAGLLLKLHVDQLHDNGGARLAAELGALSADHLEEANEEGRGALAHAGVVATVLPGCRLFLGKGPWPAARALRDAGCEVAIATDCNPGTSMILDLPLCGTLAVTQCGLTLEEALWGMTCGGARALGLADRGTLRPGERADFVVLDSADWRALFYQPGDPPVRQVFVGGLAS